MRRAITRMSLGLVGTAALVGALGAATASADPAGSKNAFTGVANCGPAGSYTFVVNSANGQGQGAMNNGANQGEWAPAHLSPGNGVFHPTAFDITFTFTPAGGPSQSFTNTDVRPNKTGSTTCALSGSQTDAQGDTFSITGTVTGNIT